MSIIIFDDAARHSLLPFTHTRPVADIYCGTHTMRTRWERFLGTDSSTLTTEALQAVFPLQAGNDNLLVNGAVFADAAITAAVKTLQAGQKLVQDNTVIAARTAATDLSFGQIDAIFNDLAAVSYEGAMHRLSHVWDIFSENDRAIREDFISVTEGRTSAAIPEHVIVTGKENLFIEEGAIISAGVIINAMTGPVYIGRNAEVLEGCMLRGPLALDEHAVIKMGARVYGATTIGSECRIGGEISNVVFFANSNKSHDGFLGNAVIGEWCNLGADTNCSNLKNNYDEVKIWDEYSNKSIRTGLQLCGLIMGDHSKCGINTMFNTGTVVGVSCNVWGGDFPEKFIPSFCWGGSGGMTTYQFNRAMDTAARMMARRGKTLSEAETAMYQRIFDATEAQRNLFANG